MMLCLPAMAQNISRRGPGCWRTRTAQSAATARLNNARDSKEPQYIGQKKGLVILAEFPDKKFKDGHDQQKYYNILNTSGYSTNEGFDGSVADYFREQSGGLFELRFDVVGPYTTEHEYAYYGKNDISGDDLHPEEMIMEMCRAADAEVDFSDYDWNGNHMVDEVFVVYAGKGEADGGVANTIWPHMWSLAEANKLLILDKTVIDIYACANELKGTGSIDGIGTFCHEFSHCLGLPDFYDLNYSGLSGMGYFDVMDQGCYAGDGFCPIGYTAYEKMACGWQDPIELSSEDMTIDSLKPMSRHGDFYIIRNDAYDNEYYLIENRQREGWDKYMPAKGLMISHVDYDQEIWDNNIPNTIVTEKEAIKNGYSCGNDHQRMTVFFANNNNKSPSLYPYLRNDSLTATSKPAASLYHPNSLGLKTMMGSILDIHQNSGSGKTMAFRYRAVNPIITAIQPPIATQRTPSIIYTLDGRVAGTSIESLPHGVYIVEGKKTIR